MEKSSTICKPTPRKKENPITDNYMIWGYCNSPKAWQLWTMKKPHHIKGCEINFYAEIIWNKIKTTRFFITSMSKLGLFVWHKGSQPSWHKLHIQNFTHRALECNWHTLYIICHPTSHSGFYISRLTQWHRLYIQNFAYRSLERSWRRLQTLYCFTTPQRKFSRF